MITTLSHLHKALAASNALTEADRQTLESLEQAAHHETSADTSKAASSSPTQRSTPWYVKLLIGFSAWLSSIFMIGFLFAAEILRFRHKSNILLTGLLFVGVAVVLYRWMRDSDSVFADQLALSLSMAGRILSILGFFAVFQGDVVPPLLIVALEVALLVVYNEKLQQFFSTVVIHGALLWLFSRNNLVPLIYLHIAALSAILYLVWVYQPAIRWEEVRRALRPIAYGTAVALLGVLVGSTTRLTHTFLRVETWWPVTAMVGIVWLLSCLSIAHAYRVSLAKPLALAVLGVFVAFCATAYQAPGIAASCFVLTLGFYQRERVLIGLAMVGLLGFVFIYYYGLRITLLQKSIAMMVPGLLLLATYGGLSLFAKDTTPIADAQG